MAARLAALIYALLSGSLGGCGEEPLIIDNFPVLADLADGPLMLAASVDDGPPVEIVVDSLSPVTIFDSFEPGSEIPEPRRRLVDLTLFGLGEGRTPTVPRGRIPDAVTLDLHACGSSEYCTVGDGDRQREIRGILGADILNRSAVRIEFSESTLRFFPDTAGSNADRGESCEAVLDNTFVGGGTLILGKAEIRYGANRAAVSVCLDEIPAEDEPPPEEEIFESGVDALLLVSTGVGPTILSESAYERYAKQYEVPDLDTLAETEVYLASGPVSARVAAIGRLALVGDAGEDSQKRGPCRELYAHKVLRDDLCTKEPERFPDCPCPRRERFCRAGSALEINEPVEVLIIADGSPFLQALRTEVRPDVPEVDGILGTAALANTRIELDYPNGRILGKCIAGSEGACTTRPAVRTRNKLRLVQECMDAEVQRAQERDAEAQ